MPRESTYLTALASTTTADFGAAAAGCRATYFDRDLLADDLRNTTGDCVSDFPWHTLGDLNGLGVVHGLSHTVRNLLGVSFLHHFAYLVRNLLRVLFLDHAAHFVSAGLGLLLRDHVADLVSASLGLLFRDHVTDLISLGAGLVFPNHAADFVADRFLALLGYHAANLVAASLGLWHHAANLVAASLGLGDHVANLVAASLSALLGHHAAALVAASLGFRHHVANLVAAGARAGLTHVLGAADFLGAAFGNPNALAALARRTLALHCAARTGAIHALAAARIPLPATGLTHLAGVAAARNLVHFLFPMTTVDGDGLGVGDRFADVVGFLAGLGFPNRLAHGVGAGLGFPDRLAHGVADFASLGFPHRFADGVGPLAGFPDWLAHGVGTSLGFPNRLAHGIANLFLTRLGDVTCHVDNFVVANAIVNRAVTRHALLLILHATHSFHDGVAALGLTTPVVACGSEVAGRRCRLQHGDGDNSQSQHSGFRSHCSDLLRD